MKCLITGGAGFIASQLVDRLIKEGYDVKIMRKPNAAAAAKALRERFSVKDSYKVGGSKKGQMVYRNYYAVR